MATVPFPERKASFQGLRLDPQGNAWVQRFAAPDEDVPWDVFDPTGRFLGTVAMPAGLHVTQIGADFVVGSWSDELEVEHVRVHRIEKNSNRKMIQLRFSAGAAAVALLLAVPRAAGAQDAPAFTVRDSAGIRIAESTRPAWAEGQGWTVGETPSFDIDTGLRNAGTFRLPDGRIAGSRRDLLVLYSPDGTRADSVALAEEDDFIWWMGTGTGDSLLAFTRESGLYAFAPDGRIAWRRQVRGLNYFFPEIVGRFADGTLLASEGFQTYRGDPALRRGLIRHVFLDPRGRQVGILGAFPERSRLGEVEVPFDWRIVVATRCEDILVGDNRTFEYMVVGRDGGVRGIVRRPFTPMAVTPEDVAAWVTMGEYLLNDDSSPAMRRWVEERRAARRATPPAETFPAYESLMSDDAGYVWAMEPNRPSDPRRPWSVFDPEGRWLGTVQFPERFWPQQIGPDWVLGTQPDAEDVAHIRMFPLRRTTGAAIAEQPATP